MISSRTHKNRVKQGITSLKYLDCLTDSIPQRVNSQLKYLRHKIY